ncbi:uncharacterized protein LOC131957913 isoform X2 [Physella acuta]|uniref:uncharacterized protein LOC131957913 isoform X2 n=1 Tax=Physella acuta TaxID=109671 RepID=UPI0027DC5E1A|nr:uncharacterized protein LOC131957913 isoform X2 [Physella acuta]
MTRSHWIRISVLFFCAGVFVVLTPRIRSVWHFSQDSREETNGGVKTPVNHVQSEDFGTGPLQNFRQVAHAYNLADLNVDNMTDEELRMTIHAYPDNVDVVCRRKLRMGKIGDGGWEVCDDPDVRPTMPCVVYSYGIHYDFSFDDDVAKLYGCHVYSFDPSMDKVEDRYNRSDKVHFYKIGLDGETYVNTRNWSLYTHGDIKKMLEHQNTNIDAIKMDIEKSEWGALPEMLASGQLKNVRQLLVEFHVKDTDRDYLLPRVKLMQGLERAGMRKFYVHKNFYCSGEVEGFPVIRTRCYEVHYMRR